MIYRAIGLMSGSSLDGLDIVYTILEETGGRWNFTINSAGGIPYPKEWAERLSKAPQLLAQDYLRLHADYGRFTGQLVNDFIEANGIQHQVQLVSSHGHTVFHDPANRMTAQLGDGAAIAAVTGLNVVSDLRSMDIALGGQGAPIVTLGEKLLFPDHELFLNVGGIANISAATPNGHIAFDVCPANRVLNLLAAEKGLAFDEDGSLAASGFVRDEWLFKLNQQAYYTRPYPKSLSNEFGTDVVYAMLKRANLSVADAMRTMVEHIAIQVTRSTGRLLNSFKTQRPTTMLVTGGGAFNGFLMQRLQNGLRPMGITLELPMEEIINYKEALIMALLGVLRWRETNTVMHSATGAARSSIGGAVWMGQEA